MRDMVTTITAEIEKLIDLQTQLVNQRPLQDLAPSEVDEHRIRQDRIRELCSDLTGLNSYDGV
jgi:hypothetical protein